MSSWVIVSKVNLVCRETIFVGNAENGVTFLLSYPINCSIGNKACTLKKMPLKTTLRWSWRIVSSSSSVIWLWWESKSSVIRLWWESKSIRRLSSFQYFIQICLQNFNNKLTNMLIGVYQYAVLDVAFYDTLHYYIR